MSCAGSVVLSEGLVDDGSDYANEGTCAHFLASFCLENGNQPSKYVKTPIVMLRDKKTGETHESFEANRMANEQYEAVYKIVPDKDFCDAVQTYVDYVRELATAVGGELHVEQRMSLEYLTGEEDAEGTSDVVILAPEEIIVVDLKFGQGVMKSAVNNPQLKTYGSSALNKYGLVEDFKRVRMIIHQPRLDHISEDTITIAEMREFEEEVRAAVSGVHIAVELAAEGKYIGGFLNPSEDACRFCKAKANCPALEQFVKDNIDAEFEDLTKGNVVELIPALVDPLEAEALSLRAKAIDLIEMWCKAIRGKVESIMLAGGNVPDFKLVQGKKGNRKWADEEEAERILKSMRLKEREMYDMKLISPTTAEKVLKDTPKRWTRISEQITQSEGPISVAPASDKRPAITIKPVADEMTNLKYEDLL